MPQTGPGETGQGWYVVAFQSSQLAGGGQPQWRIVNAASSVNARAAVSNAITGSTIVNISGPYGTKAIAQSHQASQQTLFTGLKGSATGVKEGEQAFPAGFDWNPFSWFHWSDPLSAIAGAVSGIGGTIGAGIEHGFIATLKDIWGVVWPVLEILIGAWIAWIALEVYFKDDIQAAAGTAAKLAPMAAA